MWLCLLLTKLGLLLSSNQYTKIKLIKKSTSIRKIMTNFKDQEKEEDNEGITLNVTSIDSSILLKGNNQRLITIIYNPFYYTQIKYINIQYHSICDKLVAR